MPNFILLKLSTVLLLSTMFCLGCILCVVVIYIIRYFNMLLFLVLDVSVREICSCGSSVVFVHFRRGFVLSVWCSCFIVVFGNNFQPIQFFQLVTDIGCSGEIFCLLAFMSVLQLWCILLCVC